MITTISSQKIISQIDTLDYIEKLYLLSYITKNLIKSEVKTSHNLTELYGLGKEMWQNVDIDNYIQKERASWE